jgi:hypothetical protein
MNDQTTTTGTSTTTNTGSTTGTSDNVFVPDVRTMTTIDTPKGQINVIHEITLGDLLVSTALVAMLIFMVLSRVIRR